MAIYSGYSGLVERIYSGVFCLDGRNAIDLIRNFRKHQVLTIDSLWINVLKRSRGARFRAPAVRTSRGDGVPPTPRGARLTPRRRLRNKSRRDGIASPAAIERAERPVARD